MELQYAYVNATMSPRLLNKYQKKDKKLQGKFQANSKANDYSKKLIEGYDLIHLDGKICIPIALQARILAWYHEYLAHPGQTRMEQTIRNLLHWKGLHTDV